MHSLEYFVQILVLIIGHIVYFHVDESVMGIAGGSCYANDPILGKIFEIDRENSGFLRKQLPFSKFWRHR
jgi:hypothetical protein